MNFGNEVSRLINRFNKTDFSKYFRCVSNKGPHKTKQLREDLKIVSDNIYVIPNH